MKGARTLLASIDASNLVGLRDRAIVAILIYTAARAGAAATLRRGSLYNSGDQWMLHFDEKGGKSREISTSRVTLEPTRPTAPIQLGYFAAGNLSATSFRHLCPRFLGSRRKARKQGN